MQLPRSRGGFTLIEMLLVLAIVVILASIIVPTTLRLQESNLVPQAAGDLQGALAQAKSSAVFTNRRQGVRLIPMALTGAANADLQKIRINPTNAALPNPNDLNPATNNWGNYMAWYDKIEFVEDPGDFQEMWVWSAIPILGANRNIVSMPFWTGPTQVFPAPGQLPTALAPVHVRDTEFATSANRVYGPIPANNWTDSDGANHPWAQRLNFNFYGQVRVGDRLEFHGSGQVYVVLAVNTPTLLAESPLPLGAPMDIWSGPPTYVSAATIPRPSYLVVDRPLTNDVRPPVGNRPNYRIIRQPRSVASIKPIILPKEVVIELVNLHPTHDNITRDLTGSIWMRGVSTIAVFPGTPVDIMFGPSGNVVSISTPGGLVANRNPGMVHLWVHRYANPAAWFALRPTAADSRPETQALLTIYARTGSISSYRVNQDPNPQKIWDDAAKGRGQGIGGL